MRPLAARPIAIGIARITYQTTLLHRATCNPKSKNCSQPKVELMQSAALNAGMESESAALRKAIDGAEPKGIELALKALRNATGAADSSLLREGVLKLASLTAAGKGSPVTVVPATESVGLAVVPATESVGLRAWLLNTAGLNQSIVDKTLATLAAEEVFEVSDLSLLRTLPRFSQCLTAVTREKIVKALGIADEPPLSPTGGDDEVPGWLQEAGAMLGVEGHHEAATAPAPAVAVKAPAPEPTPQAPRRRSQSFTRRGERRRANSPARGERTISTSGVGSAAMLPTQPDTCQFFLRGRCHFGSKCRLVHPEGGEGSLVTCFVCGEAGHKAKSCPQALASAGPVAATDAGLAKVATGGNTKPVAATVAEAPRRNAQRRSASFQTARERRTPKEPAVAQESFAAAIPHRVPMRGPILDASVAKPALPADATVEYAAPVPAAAPVVGVPVARSASFRRRAQRRAAAERKQTESVSVS